MTRIPVHSLEPDKRLHQIDAAVTVLVRLLARQATRDACQDSSPKDTHDEPKQAKTR